MPAVQDRLTSVSTNYQTLQEAIQKAQDDYKRNYDKKGRENPAFKVGDTVWISTVNLKLPCPFRKLGPRFIGPFGIKIIINPVAFELSLPQSYKIQPVFHLSLLKPAVPDSFPEREDPRHLQLLLARKPNLRWKQYWTAESEEDIFSIFLSGRDSHLKKIHGSPRKIFMPSGYCKNSSTETLRRCHIWESGGCP